MKTKRRFRAAVIALPVALAALCSCALPTFDTSKSKGGRAGTLTVQFNESGSASRTVVPALFASVAAYDIVCTDSGNETVASDTITALVAKTFSNIAPGSITVTVKAYSSATTKDSTTLIASGTATVTLAEGGAASAYIALAPVQTASTGSGNIALEIQWPTTSANQIWWYLDGTQQGTLTTSSDPAITTDSGTGLSTVTLSATGVASGIHTVRINFDMNGSTGTGTQLEVVNVYDNLLSNMFVGSDGTLSDTRTYTDDEVMNMTESMSTDITLRLIGGDTVETLSLTSGTTSYSTHVITSNVVTVIPSTNGVSQSISYQWNSGSVTTTGSDTPLTLTMATAMANTSSIVNNTLLLTVVSPSTGATTTYTVTIRSPIHVTTGAGLALALSVMDNNVVLDNDIDLSSYGTWYHVGTESEPFAGAFDGNGYTISGMTTDVSTIYSPSNPLTGMFGCLGTTGIIKNVHLTGLSVPYGTDAHKGGLVSYNKGTIWRCSTSGTVAGDVRVGGLVGRNDGTVSECWSNASVSGTYIGGLVGENYGTIENSYARGVVTAHWGGGLVGSNTTSGIVRNCYAAGPMVEDGTVSGNSTGYLQGFIGNSTGTVSNCFYDSSKISTSYYAGSAITSGYYGTPTDFLAMRKKATFTAASWNFSSVWTVTAGKNGGYPHLRYTTPSTDTAIASQTDLANIADNLAGEYYLTGDIALSGEWTPIGPFTGTLDGRSHTISGLTNTASGTGKDIGLFTTVGAGGRVMNLTMASVNLYNQDATTYWHTGSIAANNNGTISNCRVESGTVRGTYYIGGLIGQNTGTIEYCYSKAAVIGYTFTGGLVSTNSGTGTVRYSWATGAVTGYDCVGGFVGFLINGGTVTDCYTRSDVTIAAGGGRSGGFVGGFYVGTISRCYSTGLVASSSGAITGAGFAGLISGGSASSCFYDTDTSGQSGSGTGYTGIANAAMRTIGTYSGWNIVSGQDASNVWGIDYDGDGTAGYPFLQALPVQDSIFLSGSIDAPTLSAQINGNLGKSYILADNVTLTGNWTPVGSLGTPFTGNFNGGGHTISGLTVNLSTGGYAAMFACNTGTIKNVRIDNASVQMTGTGVNDWYVGVLVGYNKGTSSLIRHCAITGTNPVRGYRQVGGLAGGNEGTISECYSTVPVQGTQDVGGLVGGNGGTGAIFDCYARGSVTAPNSGGYSTGGLVGYAEGTIANSYATGTVTGTSGQVGGLCGAGSVSITACYYQTIPSGGNSLGTQSSAMTNAATYSSSWNLVTTLNPANVWGIDGTSTINNGYPYLQYFGGNTVSP